MKLNAKVVYYLVGTPVKSEFLKRQKSSLVNRNIVVEGHRTSVRLEIEMWSDLRDICMREGKSIHEMCSLINQHRSPNRSLTSSIRVFLIAYYRSASTEEGHIRAGHGAEYKLSGRIVRASRPGFVKEGVMSEPDARFRS